MTTPPDVLLICGSIRRPSHTLALVQAMANTLDRLGPRPMVWDLLAHPLSIADPAYHANPLQHTDEKVREFADAAERCDALILATPIYHNSYSGVLKNALDNLAIQQFYYKPVGLLSHGGDRSTQGVDHLRIVVRGLFGVAVPTQVCTKAEDYEESGGGYELRSLPIQSRLDRLAAEIVTFINLLKAFRSTSD